MSDRVITGYDCLICGDKARLTTRPGDVFVHCWTCGSLWTWSELIERTDPPGSAASED